MRGVPMMLRRVTWTSMRFKQKKAKESKRKQKKAKRKQKDKNKKRLFLSLLFERANRFL